MKMLFGGLLLTLSPFCAFGKTKKDLKKSSSDSSGESAVTAAAHAPAAAAAVAAAAKPSENGLRSVSQVMSTIYQDTLSDPKRMARHMAVGLGFGYCTGMLGVGGAPLVMTYLFMDMAGEKEQSVIGTTLCAITVPSIVGMGVHWTLGNIVWPMVPVLCAGSLVGGMAGAQASMGMNGEWMRYGFSGFLALLGGNTLWKARAAAKLIR